MYVVVLGSVSILFVSLDWSLSLTRTRVACHTATLGCSGAGAGHLVTTHGMMGTQDTQGSV